MRDLAGGEFLAHQRNVVLVGGTGTGKTRLAVALARACIRDGMRGPFYNVVDLVNRLEAEARAGRHGRILPATIAEIEDQLPCSRQRPRNCAWLGRSGSHRKLASLGVQQ